MKRLLVLFTALIVLCVAVVSAMPTTTIEVMLMAGSSSVLLCDVGASITLDTQKIVFMRSLKEEYDKVETWMNAADDLSMFVQEGQTLVFPEAGADPVVYKNKTTDIDSVEPKETVHKVELDIYDSQNYKVRNYTLHALPFDKIQFYTRKSADSILKQETKDAAYAWAPKESGDKVAIMGTTGAERSGYKMVTLEDVVELASMCDRKEFPDGRNLVLPSDMWWDLVRTNDVLKGQLKNLNPNGVLTANVVEYFGFKIHKSLGDKLGIGYDVSTSKLAPQGSLLTGNVVPCALLFCTSEVFRAGGNVEMFYKDKSTDPEGRAYTFGFQHRFKADFQMSANKYSGLLYMSKV